MQTSSLKPVSCCDNRKVVHERVRQVLDCSNEMMLLEFLVQSPTELVLQFCQNWGKQTRVWRKTYMDVVVGGLLIRGQWGDYSFFSPEDWDSLFSECLMRHRYPLSGRFLQALQQSPFEWLKPLVAHSWGKFVVGPMIAWCTAMGRLSCAENFLNWSLEQYPTFKPSCPKLPIKHDKEVFEFVRKHHGLYGYSTCEFAYAVLNHFALGEDGWCFDLWRRLDPCWRLSALEEWLFDQHNGALPLDVVELLNEDELVFLGRGNPLWMKNEKHFLLRQKIENLIVKKALSCALSHIQKDDTDKSGRLM